MKNMSMKNIVGKNTLGKNIVGKNTLGKNTVGKNIVRKNKFKTQKRRKNKNITSKQYKKKTFFGGDANIDSLKNENAAEEIQKKIDEQHSLSNLIPDVSGVISNVMPNVDLASSSEDSSKIKDMAIGLAENAAVNTIEGVSNLIGVDLTNTEKTEEKLADIKETLTDPKTQELVKETIASSAKLGAVALEAADPFIKPLITDVIDKTKQAGSELGEAGVKIALNTLEEIPGVGVVVGTARSLDTAGQALLSTFNTGSEIVTSTSDALNGAIQNFTRLKKEKEGILGRTSNSISNFTNGSFKKMGDMANKSAANVKNLKTNKPFIPVTGGTSCKRNNSYVKNSNK